MSGYSKTFTYNTEGLSYTVTVYQDPETGAFLADITTTEGAMDVNAVYFGDDDFSGRSEGLAGPLNMKGSHFDQDVQWDSAVKLSDPGLGKAGTNKETYVSEGNTLTIELDIQSLDEIDFFGIRATSTSTPEGSIKAVSEETPPEEHEEEPTFEKVFFGEAYDATGFPQGGVFIAAEEPVPNDFNVPALPEGTEPTFENYVTYYVDELGGDVSDLEAVSFYANDEDGNLKEVYRLAAPEDGWQSPDELLDAYDQAVEDQVFDAAVEEDGTMDLMAALSLPPDDEATMPDDDEHAASLEMELF
jgi:hypothetical protein